MIIMVNEMKKEIVVWMKNLTSNIMMDQSSVIMKEQKSVEMMMMVIYKKRFEWMKTKFGSQFSVFNGWGDGCVCVLWKII